MESLFNLNRKLFDIYGRFETTEYPFFRVVYSDDQFEKRLMTHTRDGFELANPMIMELPKYSQWIHGKYILEHLVAIPEEYQIEMAGKKLTYEPLWVFEDAEGNALPPIWGAIEMIVESVRKNMEQAQHGVKYKDPLSGFTTEELKQAERNRIDGLQRELFGNENDITDALAQDSAVGYGIRKRNDSIN